MSSALPDRPWGESDTRSKLIDPAIRARGWTEEHIRREETAGAIEIINDKPRRRSKGRVDYTLRIKVTSGGQPVAVAVIEAKAEHLPANHGLEQAKSYARCKRLNVPFAFRTNETAFVQTKRKLLDECKLHTIVSLPGGVFNAAGAGVKTNLLFFKKGEPTEKIWYYDLSDVKVGKRQPFTLDKFDEFFKLLPKRADSERSWTMDFSKRKQQAAAEAEPLKQQSRSKQQEANRWREKLAELKKAKPAPKKKIAEADERIAELTKEARELGNRAQSIEDAVYDLKAVNPNRQSDEDKRTPAELLDIIEQRGREVAAALAALRAL